MKYALSALAILGAILLTQNAMIRSEHSECIKWQEQESEIKEWFSTGWQQNQCKQFSITFTK